MRYHNTFGVEGSYTQNPRWRRRRRHRNPSFAGDLDLKRWISTDTVIQGVGLAAGVTISEVALSKVGLAYQSTEGNTDIAKAAIDGVGHIAVGIAGGYALNMAGQKDAAEAFAMGGLAAGMMKFLANLRIDALKGWLYPGSIMIGHNPSPRPIPAPRPMTTPVDVRGATSIRPVYSL